ITANATLTDSHGKTTKLSQTFGKNSVAPPAPNVSAQAYSNRAGQYTYTVTITGQAGAIANVVITDSGNPDPSVLNGMDQIGPSGTLTMTFDTSYQMDGALTVSVTLTNGAGNSGATTVTTTKDTAPPALAVSAPAYINNSDSTSFQVIAFG